MLDALQRIEAKGRVETAHRIKESSGAIFRYAVATHRATHDPTAALKGALTTVKHKSFASISEPTKVGELLRAIRGYGGSYVVRLALHEKGYKSELVERQLSHGDRNAMRAAYNFATSPGQSGSASPIPARSHCSALVCSA